MTANGSGYGSVAALARAVVVATALVSASLVATGGVRADGVPPVTLTIEEQESNRFLARWRVPKQLTPQAIPSPVLPDTCVPVGDRSITERTGAWLLRRSYRCPRGVEGGSIGVEFPFPNAVITTLVRVELLSGDRYAHLLAPAEVSWTVPVAAEGGVRARYRTVSAGVVHGVEHVGAHPIHLVLVVAIVSLGGFAVMLRLVTAFAAGQLVSVGLGAVGGWSLSLATADIGLAAAVAILAAEAIRPRASPSRMAWVCAAAGLAHGLGLTSAVASTTGPEETGILFLVSIVLGMDAVLLLSGAVGSGLWKVATARAPHRRLPAVAAWIAGVTAIGLALGLPATNTAPGGDDSRTGIRLPDLPLPAGGVDASASRRLAATSGVEPIQVFVAIAPFEVRHEVLVRLRDLADRIEPSPPQEIPVERQAEIAEQIRSRIDAAFELTIDGRRVDPAMLRVDYLTRDSRGVLPRLTPEVESLESAWLGVTSTYLLDRTPSEVMVRSRVRDSTPIPATVTDPESSRSETLGVDAPTVVWFNELTVDPTPIVESVAVKAPVLWAPVPSLVLAAIAAWLAVAAYRGRRRAAYLAVARVATAAVFLLAPVGNVALSLPAGIASTPDAGEARRILSRVLPNVYRAFEFPTEASVYDRLSTSVAGDALTRVYLEHRRAVTMEERGGAKARVEAVELVSAGDVEPAGDGGFVADTVWTVAGTVTHFGHRHFRQNRYRARVTAEPVEGLWKISSIEVSEEERIR